MKLRQMRLTALSVVSSDSSRCTFLVGVSVAFFRLFSACLVFLVKWSLSVLENVGSSAHWAEIIQSRIQDASRGDHVPAVVNCAENHKVALRSIGPTAQNRNLCCNWVWTHSRNYGKPVVQALWTGKEKKNCIQDEAFWVQWKVKNTHLAFRYWLLLGPRSGQLLWFCVWRVVVVVAAAPSCFLSSIRLTVQVCHLSPQMHSDQTKTLSNEPLFAAVNLFFSVGRKVKRVHTPSKINILMKKQKLSPVEICGRTGTERNNLTRFMLEAFVPATKKKKKNFHRKRCSTHLVLELRWFGTSIEFASFEWKFWRHHLPAFYRQR